MNDDINELPFSEKLRHFKNALGQNLVPVVAGTIFIAVGGFLIYLGSTLELEAKTKWFLLVFGGVFATIPAFFMAYTLPSSISHYYEKSLNEEYGVNSKAVVTDKRIESYTNRIKVPDTSRYIYVEEFHYYVGYEHVFRSKKYENEFLLENKGFYDKIEIGSEIPIRLLRVKPTISSPRLIKLGKDLGLGRKESV